MAVTKHQPGGKKGTGPVAKSARSFYNQKIVQGLINSLLIYSAVIGVKTVIS